MTLKRVFLSRAMSTGTSLLRRFHCLTIMLLVISGNVHANNQPPIVAAASDLRFALEAIAERFQAEQGQQLRLLFGSSGNFYRQIRQGAPFALYLSADEAYVTQLENAGLTQGESFIYGTGRLVYFAPHRSPLDPRAGLSNLEAALKAGTLGRFAIANPDHAPYGQAAMSTLRSLGLATAISPHLVLGENVSQAAQFAVSGSTDGGLFAYSLALSPKLASRGRYQLVPAELHPPLRQRAALLVGADPVAKQFFAYLQSPAAQQILADYGFTH